MKTKSVFFCSNCGAESPKWVGKCPACGEWNTFVEETVAAKPKKSQGYLPEGGKTHSITPVKISEVKSGEEQRIANYAANALNQLFGGTNTTIE